MVRFDSFLRKYQLYSLVVRVWVRGNFSLLSPFTDYLQIVIELLSREQGI